MDTDSARRTDVAVRPVRPDDAPAIAAIRVAGWRHAYRGLLDDGLLDQLSAERDLPRWRAHLEAPPQGHHGFIAERDEQVVGFATCGHSRDPDEPEGVAELYAIYVAPEAIGTGVGRTLIEQVMRALQEDGYAEAMLWVLEGNARGHDFYRAAGWHRDGGFKRDQMDGFDLREVRYRYRFDRGEDR
jgi:ribosomal protein S18 acetylase RimI-like enzyme